MPGLKATARFCGIVQGVVVQITTEAPPKVSPTGLNRTQIVWLVWSLYSTSASASAVFSTGDHITGFDP